MKNILAIISLFILAACADLPNDAYVSRGQPESLIDISSERVSFGVAAANTVDELTSWINDDQPDRGELSCSLSNPGCAEAKEVLESFAIPVKMLEGTEENNAVHLVYERVVARDCQNSFVSNHRNARNLNHPAFGCSAAVNMLQMVGDRRQFFDPALSDFQDGAVANKIVEQYLTK